MNNWQKIIAMNSCEMAEWLANNTSSELSDKGCAICERGKICNEDLDCCYTDAEIIEKWLLATV